MRRKPSARACLHALEPDGPRQPHQPHVAAMCVAHAMMQASGNLAELHRQVEASERAIQQVTGSHPYLIRPPYGAISPGVRRYLASRNYTIVMWSGGCIDWYFNDFDRELPVYINGLADAGGSAALENRPALPQRHMLKTVLPQRRCWAPLKNALRDMEPRTCTVASCKPMRRQCNRM
jgi:hypothetical protein